MEYRVQGQINLKSLDSLDRFFMPFYFMKVGRRMKNIIILKWDSLVLSIVSVLYGSMLLIYPQILQGYRVYDLIDDVFDNYFIGTVFIILGCLKLIGIWINNKKIKHTSLILLATVWSVFSVSFLITPPPNTVWTFSLGMAALAFGIALKEG